MAAKTNGTGIDTERNYVIVTLCILAELLRCRRRRRWGDVRACDQQQQQQQQPS